MTCSVKHETPWKIPRNITFSPLHFKLYRGKLDFLWDSVYLHLIICLQPCTLQGLAPIMQPAPKERERKRVRKRQRESEKETEREWERNADRFGLATNPGIITHNTFPLVWGANLQICLYLRVLPCVWLHANGWDARVANLTFARPSTFLQGGLIYNFCKENPCLNICTVQNVSKHHYQPKATSFLAYLLLLPKTGGGGEGGGFR